MLHVVLALFLTVPYMLLAGWSFSVLWNWFMPVIFGLPPITWVMGLGLMLVVTTPFSKHTNPDKPFEQLGHLILKWPMALGVGWVVKQLM